MTTAVASLRSKIEELGEGTPAATPSRSSMAPAPGTAWCSADGSHLETDMIVFSAGIRHRGMKG